MRSAPWWGRISLLWLMLVPVCVAIYTLLLPIAPNDFWYNVRAGEVIATTGKIPDTALFTSSVAPGTPYYYQSWIAQWMLFKVLQWGGLDWIALLRTICLTAAFVLIVAASRRRAWRSATFHGTPGESTPDESTLDETAAGRVAALSTFFAFALAATNMDIRPQTFSVLLFAVVAFSLFEWPFFSPRARWASIAATAVLMLLWVNTHGAFFTGLVLLGAYAAGEAIHYLLGRSRPKMPYFFGASLTPAALWGIGVLLALAFIATLCNPRGAGVYSYVFQLAQLQAGQKFIQEWQSPSLFESYGALFYFALLVLAILMGVLWRVARRRESGDAAQIFGARFSELIVLSLLAIMAARDVRSIIWFGLFLAPVLSGMLMRLMLLKRRAATVIAPPPRAAQLINAALALFLLFSIYPFLPAFKPGLPLPAEYAHRFAPNPKGYFPAGFADDPPFLLERETPVEAVEYLQAHPPRGRLWNDFVFGSYLVWASRSQPKITPHADPRVEMYPLEFWEEYGRLIAGPPDAARTLEKQGFTDALLDRTEQKGLIAQLQKSGWRVAFPNQRSIEAGRAVVLRRS